jgi:type I restriction enzyme M protein
MSRTGRTAGQNHTNNFPATSHLTRPAVQGVIKGICDVMRRSSCAGALQYIPEISWLLFLRILDERDELAESNPRRRGRSYRPALSPPYRWRDWASPPAPARSSAAARRLPGWKREQLRRRGRGAVMAFVRDELLPHLHRLAGRADAGPNAAVISAVLRSVTRTRLGSEADFLTVLDRLDGVRESSIDTTHVFPVSEVYEGLLLKMGEKAADGGQFFTPREVIRAMVRVIDPRPGETIYDPCCGTGGFLAESFEHMRRCARHNRGASAEWEHKFFGREKDSLVYPITLANLLLHGIDLPHVWNGNTLTDVAADDSLFRGAPSAFDVVLTNPPFGGKEGKEAQRRFTFPTASTQVLFLQHVLDSLRPGGRCGIVVDEGVLFRTADTAFVQTKRKLLNECDLWCVVSLPPGTFASAGAGVKTNLLFFTKGRPTKAVWYYDLSWRSVGKKTPLRLHDFEEFFRLLPGREDGPRSWSRPLRDIEEGGYDIKATNPHPSVPTEPCSVADLMGKVEEANRELQRCLDALRRSCPAPAAGPKKG